MKFLCLSIIFLASLGGCTTFETRGIRDLISQQGIGIGGVPAQGDFLSKSVNDVKEDERKLVVSKNQLECLIREAQNTLQNYDSSDPDNISFLGLKSCEIYQ